jgi:membrane protein implicated in regulation of membrane protease activity
MLPDSILMNALFIIAGLWFLIFIICLITLARREDMFVPEKIFWAVIIFFAPVVGLIFYLVFSVRKRKMKQRG